MSDKDSSLAPSHLAVNACLAPLCSMHGLAVTTTEAIGDTKTRLHPVQVGQGHCKKKIMIQTFCIIYPHLTSSGDHFYNICEPDYFNIVFTTQQRVTFHTENTGTGHWDTIICLPVCRGYCVLSDIVATFLHFQSTP